MNETAIIRKYFENVSHLIEKINTTQSEAIEMAANLLFSSYEAGGKFFVFGSGHSHMIAEELYARAGGYAAVKSILCPELMRTRCRTKAPTSNA